MTSSDTGAFSRRRNSAHPAPAPEEVEISLFGPGVGECAVVHLGGGDWMIVDSCVDRITGEPVALSYLAELGVDVATAVKVVVASHWHDDHIDGMSKIVAAAAGAQFWCSAALTRNEFFMMVAAASSLVSRATSGLSEFRAILDMIETRGPHLARSGSVSPRLAKEDVVVFRRPGAVAALVCALSPSDGAMKLSWHQIAQDLPQLGKTKTRVVALQPNQIAVVLHIQVGKWEFLLGADLEENRSPTLGWKAVVNSTTKPAMAGDVFKIAHHGSENAHSDDVWRLLLKANAVGLVTPFATGGKFLPSPADLQRLRRFSDSVYCTSPPGGRRPPRRHGAVDRLAAQVARNRRVLRGPAGHVQIRIVGDVPVAHTCEGAFLVT